MLDVVSLKAWQECPNCGAVTYIWRDPVQREYMAYGDLITAAMLTHPDGRPCDPGDPVTCRTCGTHGASLLGTAHYRIGGEIPQPKE